LNRKKVISNLKNQEWSFDTLFPDFDSSLKLESNKSYITSRCADFYLNIEADISITTQSKDNPYIITNNNSCLFWDIALGKISSVNDKLSLIDNNPEYVELIKKSLEKIKKNNPKVFGYLMNYIPFILIVKKNGAYSLSTPHLFGTIILNESIFSSKEDLEITIVHELAHQELFLINLIDSLINEKFLSNLQYSPFQREERPPLGRLHASHALFRMTEYSLISENKNYKKIEKDFGEMIKTLHDYELSHLGKEILKSYKLFYNNVYKK